MSAQYPPSATQLGQLTTPALVVDRTAFDRNVAAMSSVRPGAALRPHVKAFKSTAVAHALAQAGHQRFCCATVREIEGMVSAGLGQDLLLANEVLDTTRLGALVQHAQITVAVDSPPTIQAAADGGVQHVLIDVNVGLPRCGCAPETAGALATQAREAGLNVRGVMGYEGHVMDWSDRDKQRAEVDTCMARLQTAHAQVGGDITSAGGTGTFDLHNWASEVQAGSYVFMDTHYARVGLPFEQSLYLLSTVISVSDGWFVLDGGLKSLGMDHGNPVLAPGQPVTGDVFFCSDEHTTVTATSGPPQVGDRVLLVPGHVDPTVAKHPMLQVVSALDARSVAQTPISESWPVDLRDW